MLKIKLARFGKRNQPHFRFVVVEAKTKRDGEYTANVGHYAPTATPKILEIDVAAYTGWIAKGAQPTETVAGLFKRFQSGTPFPAKPKKLSKKAKAKEVQAAAEAAKPKETVVAEPVTPVTEPAAEVAAPEVASTETVTESK